MNCPKCYQVSLFKKKTAEHKFEIDLCPKCHGIWFDHGELTKILGGRAEPLNRVPVGSVVQDIHPCPKCKESLHSFMYPSTSTMVEMCGNCLGFFLDFREWKQIYDAREHVMNTLVCPKCHHEQPKSEVCFACGYIFPTAIQRRDMPEPLESSSHRPLPIHDPYRGFISQCIHNLNPFD